MGIESVSIHQQTFRLHDLSALNGWGKCFFVVCAVLCLLFFQNATLASDVRHIYLPANADERITDRVMIHARPGVDYTGAKITLSGSSAQIVGISAAIASKADFTLPRADLRYDFNPNTGRIDIFNPAVNDREPILSLPVNREGRTTQIRLDGGNYTRLGMDASTLRINQRTKPPFRLLEFDIAGGERLLVTHAPADFQIRPQARYISTLMDDDLPILVFDDAPELSSSLHSDRNFSQTQTDDTSKRKTSLFVVEADGTLRPGIRADVDTHVLYTLLSKDEQSVYVALDPGYDKDDRLDPIGHVTTRDLIAQLNCALFEVNLQDSTHRCIDAGHLPVPMSQAFRRAISDGERKPLQLDAEGNLYYLAYSFQRSARDGRYVFSSPSSETSLRSYRKDASEVTDLTLGAYRVGQFIVLNNGSVVYTATDRNRLNLAVPRHGTDEYFTVPLSEELDPTSFGDIFFTLDDENTVVFGVSSGTQRSLGIQFAQRSGEGRVRKQLNTELFASAGDQQPTPMRILMADDGYVYGLFNRTTGGAQLFRVLPYQQEPVWTFPTTSKMDREIQISKGYLYYVDRQTGVQHDRDIIQVVRLADGQRMSLLADSEWNERYDILNWRISGDILNFAAFDTQLNLVVLGGIDTLAVRRTGSAQSGLELQQVSEASQALGSLRDIEIIRPRRPDTDYGGAPHVVNAFTHPDNLYSVSVEFSKHMSVADISNYLKVRDEQTDQNISGIYVWNNRVVHLVLDREPSTLETIPLERGKSYRLHIPSFVARDHYNWDFAAGLSHSFTTRSDRDNEFSITAESTHGGTVTPSSRIVSSNEVAHFAIRANTGFELDEVTGCGGGRWIDAQTYETAPATRSCTLRTSFKALTRQITLDVGSNGSSSWGTQGRQVSYDSTQTLAFTPNTGYVIDSVSGCNGTRTGNTYTTGTITQDCTIQARFRQIEQGQLIANRYRILGATGDIVEDIQTGLQWMRCALGQTWTGTACTGNARLYNFDETSALSGSHSGFTDWRMPTITELRTLVYCSNTNTIGQSRNYDSCGVWGEFQSPTIREDVFPGIMLDDNWPWFWSSTTATSQGERSAWGVFFDDGYVMDWPLIANFGGYVRLMRTPQGATLPSTYTVSTSAGSGGTISPISASVNAGSVRTFTITPHTGYQIESVSGCGGNLSGNSYTTGAINSNCTVTAQFRLQHTDALVYLYGFYFGNADDERAHAGQPVVFYFDQWSDFNFAEINNFRQGDVLQIGTALRPGNLTIEAFSGSNEIALSFGSWFVYLENLDASIVNAVAGETDLNRQIDILRGFWGDWIVSYASGTDITYTVSVNTGAGGSVTPSSMSVYSGGTASFDIIPNAGYRIASVSGCDGRLSGNRYTTGTITNHCTVTVQFEQQQTDGSFVYIDVYGWEYFDVDTLRQQTSQPVVFRFAQLTDQWVDVWIERLRAGDVLEVGVPITSDHVWIGGYGTMIEIVFGDLWGYGGSWWVMLDGMPQSLVDRVINEYDLNRQVNIISEHLGSDWIVSHFSGAPGSGDSFANLASAMDAPSLTFHTAGDANWGVDTTQGMGGSSARSGTISHNQRSYMETTLTGPATISFRWKVSSEANFDFLRFSVNGVERSRISGETSWATYTESVPEGTHTLRWSYTKDGSVSHGQDRGWVDQLSISTVTTPTANLASAMDAPSLTFHTAGDANWGVDTTQGMGGSSARSGTISHNQRSYMETTLTGPATISFRWKVSSEANFDFLRFSVNGVERSRISGETSWATYTESVPEGTHTLRWSYTKDGSVDHGQDRGWVDQLSIEPFNDPPIMF